MKIPNLYIGGRSFLWFLCLALLLAGFLSCRKDKVTASPTETKSSGTAKYVLPAGTPAQLAADSLFLYAKTAYLWNAQLPSYEDFNARQFVRSDLESTFNSELLSLTRYAINPETGKPYEYKDDDAQTPKYSYVFNSSNANPVASVPQAKSSVDLEGNGYDFGFMVGLFPVSAGVYNVRVEAVYKGSPADAAGIKRGDVFRAVNGQQVTSNFTQAKVDFLNNALFSSPGIQLQVYRSSTGKTFGASLSRTAYSSNPVYRDTVYNAGNKKIGYLALARFSALANARLPLDNAFRKFATAGVTNLIVDLRYNGGGYVGTAEYLTELIAPSGLNGKVMYTERFNESLQKGDKGILSAQPSPDGNGLPRYTTGGRLITYADHDYSEKANTNVFDKKGSLSGVQKVVFIVTGNTASASELVINSLKAYPTSIDVKIVGQKTYGKPVGFFPIKISGYEIYFSMFETRNAAGQGGYYTGMVPDYISGDDSTVDFGELRESSTANAYNYLVNGTFAVSAAKTSAASSVSEVKGEAGNFKLLNQEFKGMIENRSKLVGD